MERERERDKVVAQVNFRRLYKLEAAFRLVCSRSAEANQRNFAYLFVHLSIYLSISLMAECQTPTTTVVGNNYYKPQVSLSSTFSHNTS